MVRTYRRALRAVVLSIALVAVASGAAAATDAVFEPAGEAAFVSNGALTLMPSLGVTCNATFSGALETGLFALSSGEPVGQVDEVAMSGCSGGAVVTAIGLPWPLTVDGTSGTLPEAATGLGLTLSGVQIQHALFGGLIRCVYAGTASLSAALTGSNPYAIGEFAIEGPFVRISGGGICPATTEPAGTLEAGPGQTLIADPFTAAPRDVRFGEVRANEASSRRSITVQNDSNRAIRIDRVRVTTRSTAFTVPLGGFDIDGESMSNISVRFEPTATGDQEAVVEFEQGPEERPKVLATVVLRGRGI